MASLRRKLPSLTALTVFEAASRLSSFTRAAAELGVTQAAVSRQINLLEQELGFALFLRLHRRIELTEKGRQLAQSTTEAFSLIATTLKDMVRADARDEIAVSASLAFSHFWLLPRIPEFSRLHPSVKLRIVSQDASPDLETSDVDLAIRFGGGMWPDGQADLLFEDEIFPICSPAFAAAQPELTAVNQLLDYPLISNDADDPTWTGWNEWLAAFSIRLRARQPGLRCSFHTEAIYAAVNGHGIALGWKRLVGDLLAQNRLVRVTDASIRPRNAYFVVVPKRRDTKAAVSLFVDWLKKAA